jgi:hypothetical protein
MTSADEKLVYSTVHTDQHNSGLQIIIIQVSKKPLKVTSNKYLLPRAYDSDSDPQKVKKNALYLSRG